MTVGAGTTGGRALRWAVVVLVGALLVGVPAAIAARPGSAQADPDELRDRIAASADVPWTGYAEARAGLALPRIPALSDVTTLFSGVTRLRGWYAAPDRARTDVLTPVGERDRYTTPRGQAVWDYGAELLTLVAADPVVRLPRPDDLLPPALARRLLAGTAASDPATALPSRRVAGVDAAGVRVTVADPETTVGALDVWADPATGLPVAVEVRARGVADPLISTAFGELEQGPPDPAALEPRRGPGAGVTRSPTSDLFGVLGRGDGASLPDRIAGRDREPPEEDFPALGQYGTTLGQLVAVPLPADLAATLLGGIDRAGAGRTLPVEGQGAALETPLLTLAVVRSNDGGRAWVLAGLVPDAAIDAGAADLLAGGAA
ncbi:hypothetical protein [Actinomycetospora cinnamomea]|uniref:MucB/RseB-like sigma(E) regulatory protein n=1 Tax=Actinomycetospora cinnamomea TaxID=663609 RepID=A0A2U1FID7_9PSEU|nr:hypothetical protein [Actinomycetospora cinnamomea]PVZ11927.1 hypothetical protein C8D89_103257 [Actinomycetospora cinnamomea]